jgi:hypothetical protein
MYAVTLVAFVRADPEQCSSHTSAEQRFEIYRSFGRVASSRLLRLLTAVILTAHWFE